MKLSELREQLDVLSANYPTSDPIILVSRDEEGNGFRELQDFGESSCEDEGYGNYEIGLRELTPELIEQGYTDEDIKDGEDCIVLWP